MNESISTRERRATAGICIDCGKEPARRRRLFCVKCSIKRNTYGKARARATKERRSRDHGVRWRYSVTPLEYAQRPRSATQWAKALGYTRSRERAVRAAETACDALIKAEKFSKKRGETKTEMYEGET